MKLKKNSIFLLAFIFGLGLFQAEAQYRKTRVTGSRFKPRKRKKPRNYINSIKGEFAIGTSTYYGDLCDGGDCLTPLTAITLGASYRVNESISIKAGFTWLRLKAEDANNDDDEVGIGRQKRNLSFRSENFELAAVAVYDIFSYHKMYRRRGMFSPYIYLGVGATYFNPRTSLTDEDGNETWYNLSEYNTEDVDYSNIAFVIPYGLGVRMKITPHLDISAEFGSRWAFTDYLDDVSDKYAVQSNLDAIGKALSDRSNEYNKLKDLPIEDIDRSGDQRGNKKSNDGYFMTQIRLSYTLKVTKQSYNINSNVSRLRIIKSIKRK